MPKVFLSMLVGVMICLHAPCVLASSHSQNQYSGEIVRSSLKIDGLNAAQIE